MKIEIKLFGQLKECFGATRLQLETSGGSLQVQDLKKQILHQSGDSEAAEALVTDSALATETRIFQDEEVIYSDGDFLLLPPVCGG